MGKLYFAKNKSTKELYVGMKHNAGFSNIGDLKRSITYKNQYYRSDKTKEDYDFYYVDVKNMTINKVE